MTVLFCFLIALVGIVIGGFLGRASYALPRGEYREILRPKCPFCGKPLPVKYSIPLIGFFFSETRCPHCGEKRARSVFMGEILFGVACLLLYLVYHFSYLFFVYAVVAGLLLLLSLIDLDIQEAPHGLLLAILLFGVMTFVFSFFDFSLTGTAWWEHLVGAFVISLPLFIVMMVTGGVGGGDVKLMFVLGLLLGYKLTLIGFLIGIITAAIAAILLHFLCDKGGKYPIPLVPFLSFGAMVSLLCGNAIIELLF